MAGYSRAAELRGELHKYIDDRVDELKERPEDESDEEEEEENGDGDND